MGSVVKGLDKVMQSMDLEKVRVQQNMPFIMAAAILPTLFQISTVMEKFESQFEDLDVHSQVGYKIQSAYLTLSLLLSSRLWKVPWAQQRP